MLWLLIPGIPLALIVLFLVAVWWGDGWSPWPLRLVFRRVPRPRSVVQASFDGKLWEVPVVYGHWLPRFIRVPATTLNGTIRLAAPYNFRFDYVASARKNVFRILVPDVLIAHELVHVWRCMALRVWLLYFVLTLWLLVTRGHGRSPYEQEAREGAPLILNGTHPHITAYLTVFAPGTVDAEEG